MPVSDLLAGVLAALLSTNPPAATGNLVRQTTGLSIQIPNPTDPAETELRELMSEDDDAVQDVTKWTDDARAAAAAGAPQSEATLSFRVHQRLNGVKIRYEDYVRLHPNYVNGLLAYGSFLNDTGDTNGAMTQWEKARQIAPNNAAAWDDLGKLYEENDVKKALDCFTKAISLDPNQAVYYHNLAAAAYIFRTEAKAYWKIDDQDIYNLAIALYQRAMKLAPDDFILASNYAQCFYGINPPRWKQGLEAWTQCLKIAHDETERQGVYIHLARINVALGNYAEARHSLDAITNSMYLDLKKTLTRSLDNAMKKAMTNGLPQPLR